MSLEGFRPAHHAHILQAVYLGLEMDYNQDTDKCEYALCTHDGTYVIDYVVDSIDLHRTQSMQVKTEIVLSVVLDRITRYLRSNGYKISIIGLSSKVNGASGNPGFVLIDPKEIASSFWFDLDALPFIISTRGSSVDERASSAARKSVIWLSPQIPGSIPRISVGFRHEVEVDLNGMIKLCDLADYRKTVKPETWEVISCIAHELRTKKVKASFFSATPQGGGVALMRHALIRLCRLLGLDISWYVAKPSPEIFDITKRKFHNVLQGVAPEGCELLAHEMEAFIEWSDTNVRRYWADEQGPIKTSDVIIIDDPQLCGIIPQIKNLNPSCKVIYRSHIEIRSDLIKENPEGPQAITWNFLWQFISLADLFVSHPIKGFIPDCIPPHKYVLMGASTDALDGLNKEMNDADIEYYQLIFNRLANDQCGKEIDFTCPYIIQVARFDPSKGIPHVIESFRLLREKLADTNLRLPSLIICGTGSIDDPDGTVVYKETRDLIQQPKYASIAGDIVAVRLPACDQLFNSLLRKAHVALQLSTREGFEVKVTEALHKGVPVVAFRAGGIPLQIRDGETGFLVDVADEATVADRLFDLFTDKDLYERMSATAKKTVSEEFFNVYQTLNWLYMINHFADLRREENSFTGSEKVSVGHGRWIKEFWQEEYAKGRFHFPTDANGNVITYDESIRVTDGIPTPVTPTSPS